MSVTFRSASYTAMPVMPVMPEIPVLPPIPVPSVSVMPISEELMAIREQNFLLRHTIAEQNKHISKLDAVLRVQKTALDNQKTSIDRLSVQIRQNRGEANTAVTEMKNLVSNVMTAVSVISMIVRVTGISMPVFLPNFTESELAALAAKEAARHLRDPLDIEGMVNALTGSM